MGKTSFFEFKMFLVISQKYTAAFLMSSIKEVFCLFIANPVLLSRILDKFLSGGF